MLKRLTMCTAVLAFAAGLMLTGANTATAADKTGTWSGIITNDMCGAKDANAGKGAQCTKDCVSKHAAKLALYDTANKEVYVLEPQAKASGHEGHNVTVKGTLDESTKTIHVTSLTMKGMKAAPKKSTSM
ncbi:MAG TPA: hypothetical protein VN661_00345 [Candidatus Acidoferrales bacterium]|nr:hypothetical protein [Candidatus Acidoferrales bacterium]